jgi:hypothetical protein
MIVVAGNNPFDEPASASALAAMSSATFNPQYNAVWGPLNEHAEENSALQAASSASDSIHLNLRAAINANGFNPKTFTVGINGVPATVRSVQVAQNGNSSTDLTLQLSPGTLHAGNNVNVFWQNLVDAGGRALTGYVSITAQ